jgi:hypothetical protein
MWPGYAFPQTFFIKSKIAFLLVQKKIKDEKVRAAVWLKW